jgi:hypothetical protein
MVWPGSAPEPPRPPTHGDSLREDRVPDEPIRIEMLDTRRDRPFLTRLTDDGSGERDGNRHDKTRREQRVNTESHGPTPSYQADDDVPGDAVPV